MSNCRAHSQDCRGSGRRTRPVDIRDRAARGRNRSRWRPTAAWRVGDWFPRCVDSPERSRGTPFRSIVTQDMASTRLETLKSMVAQQPSVAFLRYGLAMEYRNAGDLEAAIVEFRALLGVDPDYSAAYFHGGQTLERL